VSRLIFLDSGPLSLLVHRAGDPAADAARLWGAQRISAGDQLFVPEIVDYELRRELVRAGKRASVHRLDVFNVAKAGRYLPVTTRAMRLAADLWAQARQRGIPTADPSELDIDVVLAAQVLTSGLPPSDVVVATTNVSHLSRFVNAELWTRIV
jgi:predicted nucleic acid-binding protein